ncbi:MULTISPECIES: hypothetical protein [Bacteroides]|uniref:hypothetical protein n=1 Tax=Bacteroides TaxID=816 RepID=UPI00259CF0B7|nr:MULTISPECIES: hypothetical protein [Bacteroides]
MKPETVDAQSSRFIPIRGMFPYRAENLLFGRNAFFGGKQCFFGGKHRRLDSSFAGKNRIFAAINLPDV